MARARDEKAGRRGAVTRERVLRAAVALADDHGIAAVTMRKVAKAVGLEAMSLYNHVTGKDDVLTGMVDLIGEEIAAAAASIDDPAQPDEWKDVARRRMLAAREVQLSHTWAHALFQSRATMTPAILTYFDSLLGLLRYAGFTLDLAHHALHALGSHALGVTPEMFGDASDEPELTAIALQRRQQEYPNLSEMLRVVSHDPASTLGMCDDQAEFEFAIDLLLEGLEQLRTRGRDL